VIPQFILRYVYPGTTVVLCLVVVIAVVGAYKQTKRPGFAVVAVAATLGIWLSLGMQLVPMYFPKSFLYFRVGYPYLVIADTLLFAVGLLLITRDYRRLARLPSHADAD